MIVAVVIAISKLQTNPKILQESNGVYSVLAILFSEQTSKLNQLLRKVRESVFR